jgi:8-oxo-dGTP pyrophosphatase MutT (NUDIX family)
VEFGEDPRDAVVREVHEETGLDVMIGDTAHVHSVRFHASNSGTDMHSVRIVYDGWVPRDAPEPHVVERDGSTVDVAWFPLADVESGAVTVSGLVSDALAAHAPAARQRLAAYALVRRGDEVLLTRISATGAHPGAWDPPGGGGRPRRVARRCPGARGAGGDRARGDRRRPAGVHDEHFTGTAPTGRTEDFHGVHLVFAADVGTEDAGVVETGGTTDRVAWVSLGDVTGGRSR